MWQTPEEHPVTAQIPRSTYSSFVQKLRGIMYANPPTLRSIGQCLFGLALLFIISGIALCIWGFVGKAIRPFQIFGPTCVGVGLVIYIIGCVLCCREYPGYESRMKEQERFEKTKRVLKFLADPNVIDLLQGEPEMFEDFRQVAIKVLNTGLDSENGDVITNLYVNQRTCEA